MFRKRNIVLLVAAIFLVVGSRSSFAQYFKTHQVRTVVRNGKAAPVGLMSTSKLMTLNVVLPLTNQQGLHEFLNELYDPNSPEYHQYLTPTQFTALYGPSVADYDATVAYFKANGFKVIGGSRGGMNVVIQGTVSAVNTAFHVTMRTYTTRFTTATSIPPTGNQQPT